MKKGSIHINTAVHGQRGSALILVVVLTVLLAAVGVLFLMTSRIDEMASSGILRTRELRAGVNIVLDRIRTVLTDDLLSSGDPNMLNGPGDSDDPCAVGDENEYWDYPGDDDPWLASLEPEVNPSDPCDIYWPHITDLYDDNFDVPVDPCYYDAFGQVTAYNVTAGIIGENDSVGYVENASFDTIDWGNPADADGDGVSDSRWIVLPGISSSQGEDIYAAVRIIDNCGMININTAYRDPTSLTVAGDWDGSLLAHINLQGISAASETYDVTAIQALRYGNITPPNFSDYENDLQYEFDVSRQILNPIPGYLPFDIGDELELRNRYFLSTSYNYPGVIPRCSLAWPRTFNPQADPGRRLPFGSRSTDTIIGWFDHVKPDIDEPSGTSVIGDYNRRILSTTYSFDRVITPWADTNNIPNSLRNAWYNWTNWNDPDSNIWSYRPVSVNDPDPNLIAAAIWLGLPDDPVILSSIPQFTGLGWTDEQIRERLACQMAVNLADFIDRDSPETVTSFTSNGVTYYGHEATAQQLYISMIAVAQYDDGVTTSTAYAIELYNPGQVPTSLNNWELDIEGATVTLTPITVIQPGQTLLIADLVNATTGFQTAGETVSFSFSGGNTISLIYTATGIEDDVITVLSIPDNTGFDNLEVYTAYRGDITYSGGVVARLRGGNFPVWDTPLGPWSLAIDNDLTDDSFTSVTLETAASIQGPITTGPLRTIGELSNVLALGTMNVGGTLYTMSELWENLCTNSGNNITDIAAGRIDFEDNAFGNLTRYLTVFNPFNDGLDNDGNGLWDEPEELAVPGRININTAPWFVIAQLPWMQYFTLTDSVVTGNYQRARAVFDDRIANGPYENIADLMRVAEMKSLAGDIDSNLNSSPAPGPDFTDDAVDDDFEERDILFHRMSNLVTVRSDVFTAYILVRIGQNGPQKRMIAVFDRSRVFSPADKPKLVALHPVPDPR